MRDFLNPIACGDGEGCGCGGTFETQKTEPDCGGDCDCHDDTNDCGCDNGECC